MSNLQEKIKKIYSYLETNPVSNTQEDAAVTQQAQLKARSAFTEAVKASLDQKHISYDEAQARIKMSDFSEEDKNIIQASIGDYEAVVTKRASATKEVEVMDPIQEELKRIAARTPAYARDLAAILEKKGFLGATGRKPQVDSQALGVVKDDKSRIAEQISEEDKRMGRDGKRVDNRMVDPARKTAGEYETGTTSKHITSPGKDLRESDRVDSKKWDNKVGDKELSRATSEEAAMKGQATEDIKKKNDSVVRASENLSVKFADAEGAWVIADKKSGEIAIKASVEDITGGFEFTPEAVGEIKSAAFGAMIVEDIDTIGLEATARNLLGDKFDKLASESVNDMIKVADTEDIKQRYFVLKGMFETLKTGLSKVASNPAVAYLIKKAGGSIAVLEKSIGAPPMEGNQMELPFEEAATDVGNMVNLDEVVNPMQGMDSASGIGAGPTSSEPDIEGLRASVPPQLLPGLETLIEKYESSEGDDKGTKKLEDSDDKPAADKPAKKDDEDSDSDDKPAKKGFPFGKKDDDKEKEPKKSSIKSMLHKIAEKVTSKGYGQSAEHIGKDENPYDVTPKDNFMAMFEHNKGNITQDGKKFMTIESLSKEIASLASKMPKGKLAHLIGSLVKNAEAAKVAGINEKEYMMKILGDSEYVNEYFSFKTPESVQKESDSLQKDTNNAYAQGATKMKVAMEMSQLMQHKGLIKSGKEALADQVGKFMNMDEKSFTAFAGSVEAIAPTTELEDGRFKVEAMRPDSEGNVVKGSVDGHEVAWMNGDDIQSENGLITKAHLQNALSMLKRALTEGALDEALSNNRIQNTPGVNLDGLSLGIQHSEKEKPVLDVRELL